jgi:hypothetical protein
LEETVNQDLEHLKLLSIFHYIVAGICALCACFPLIHFFMGLAMVAGWGQMGEEAPGFIGWFLMGFAALFIICGWALAICLALAGKYLSERSHYNFCFVMACVACVFTPFGTVLGVFTLLVLVRDSVKRLFGVPTVEIPVPAASEAAGL